MAAILLDSGWARFLPERGAVVLEAVARLEPVAPRELHAYLKRTGAITHGLAASAWTEVEQWTDADLRSVGLVGPDASAANFYEVRKRDLDASIYEESLSSMSQRIDHSVGGMLKLLVVCGVVLAGTDGTLRVNPIPPSVLEVLPTARVEERFGFRSVEEIE